MAVSQAALTAAETADFALDMPLLGTQSIPVAVTTKLWHDGAAGTTGSGDHTLSTSPATRAYDGYSHLPTQPDTTAGTSWSFVMDFGTGIEFDFCMITGHNFGAGSEAYTQVDLEVADDAAFTVNVLTIPIVSNPADDTRIVTYTLDDNGTTPTRYTGVQYARLVLTQAGDTDPELGELILGRRRQLGHPPKLPFDPDNLVSEWGVTSSKSGVQNRLIYNEHAYRLNARLQPFETTYISDLNTWFRATGGIFTWCLNPSSAPDSTYWMILDEYELVFPKVGYSDRELVVSAIEQGPESYYLEQEA